MPNNVDGSAPNNSESDSTELSLMEVMAETTLGPSPQRASPDSFAGRLVELRPNQLLRIRTGQNVIVGFEGKRYKFSRLEPDGSFELVKDW